MSETTNISKTVDIIFPVRNRADYLPHFLTNVLNLSYDKSKISIYACLNDSTDNSDKILCEFQKNHKNEYNKIDIKVYNLNSPEYGEGHRGGSDIIIQNNGKFQQIKQINTAHKVYKNLARLRNSLMYNAKSDYIFSVDTDIMIKPDTLSTLINNIETTDYDMASALICNGHEIHKKLPTQHPDPYIFTNAMTWENDKYVHIKDYEDKEIVNVDLTGAVFVATKELCKSGAKYGEGLFCDKYFGEDANFCHDAIERGFKIGCNVQEKLTHCMSKELLDKYIAGEFIF